MNGRFRLSTGDSLYTTRGDPLLTITADDCGTHDILHGPGTSWLLSELEGRDTSVEAYYRYFTNGVMGRINPVS
jgi:hypothetical protein